MKLKGGTQMRTTKLFFLILSIALAAAFVIQLPAAQAVEFPYMGFTYVDNVAKDPTDVPPPIKRSNNKTVTVDLYAQEYIAEIEPGKLAWVWTFTDSDDPEDEPGTIPGPMIRVMVGDTVVINLTNNLKGNVEPHNIDLHAAMGPGGGAAVTEIEPGETKTLRFKALREGAYIYHCAAEGMAWEHVSYGMYGLIMVEPKGGLKRVDKEFYFGQSDWYLKQAGAVGAGHGVPEYVYVLDEAKASDELPTMYSFNGHKKALWDGALFGNTIRADQGDKVRVFMVTGGPNKGSNFHIIGTIWDKVYKGHSKDAVRNEETVVVPPGSAAVFELITPVPGQYLIVDHALWRVPKGAGGFMWVDQTDDWPDDIFSPDPSTLP
jgi:nitrite reductase (NO-forming)